MEACYQRRKKRQKLLGISARYTLDLVFHVKRCRLLQYDLVPRQPHLSLPCERQVLHSVHTTVNHCLNAISRSQFLHFVIPDHIVSQSIRWDLAFFMAWTNTVLQAWSGLQVFVQSPDPLLRFFYSSSSIQNLKPSVLLPKVLPSQS